MNTNNDALMVMKCLQGGCSHHNDFKSCPRCGFNRDEDKRRKKLPMIKGEDGLLRKYVGKSNADGLE